jgi:hypothetical protein
MFPTLTQNDLDAAWKYADREHEEIERDIAANEDAER